MTADPRTYTAPLSSRPNEKIRRRFSPSAPATSTTRVGQGSSTLLVGPTNETMLIDSGDWQDDGGAVIEYLQQVNVTRIDYLVTSRADAYHIGGHVAVIEYLETDGDGVGALFMAVREVRCGSRPARQGAKQLAWIASRIIASARAAIEPASLVSTTIPPIRLVDRRYCSPGYLFPEIAGLR